MKSRLGTRLLAAAGAAVVLATLATSGGAAASAAPRAASVRASGSITYTTFGYKNQGVSTPIAQAGTFSNAPQGASAQIFSKPFPFTGAMQAGQKETLKVAQNGTAPFSFSVQPQRATEYFVELLNPNGSVNNTFQLQTVYVVSTRTLAGGQVSCSGGTCRVTFTLLRFLPAGVSKYELTKAYRVYLGVNFAKSGTPPSPKYMYLQEGWTGSKTTPVPKVADEYEATFHVSFKATEPSFSYVADACTIDTETKDGFGLPGTHGCGSEKVSTTTSYLG
jgi:hypothetical protein